MRFSVHAAALLGFASTHFASTHASAIHQQDKRAVGAPSVTISHPQATIVGSSSGQVQTFKGVPFAQPPVNQLRLRPPQKITKSLGTVQATGAATSCPQQFLQTDTNNVLENIIAEFADNPFFQNVTNTGEDCLTLNIFRPATATASSKLPVLFWIYGGGFEFGSTQTYDATQLVELSISLGKPIVYVAVNYRLSAFGFLGGKEVLNEGVGNLGLLDQRAGLQWVADNIANFGGDPSKVTIWGESAGSISVLDQMVLYNGDNTYNGKELFRGAIMDSGSIVPANPLDCPKAQAVYDLIVKNAGCSSASDTLACLRSVSYETFLNAQNSVPSIFSYESVALAYLPRPDGKTLMMSPEDLIQDGHIAKVPFIVGDQEDEGTLFALVQSNLTTTQDLYNYFQTVFFPDASPSVVQGLVDVYPDDPSAGAPFGTGPLYNLYPQQKRLAAILGDITFILTRRIFLLLSQLVHPDVPSWTYLASYDNVVPIVGTTHATDILPAYGITPGFPQNTIQSYYLSFVNTLNPNTGTNQPALPNWPQWSKGQQLIHFNALSNDFVADNFRNESYTYLINTRGKLRI